MSERVAIEAEIVGVEQVNAGFASMQKSSQEMSRDMRQASRDIMVFGTAAMGITRVAESFGLLSDEQAKALSGMAAILTVTGSLIRATEVLTRANLAAAASFATKTAAAIADTAASLAHALAESARGIATAVANAVTNPLFLPVMLAAAATASAVVSSLMPTAHTGLKQSVTGGLVNVLPNELILKPAQLRSITENSVYTSSTQTRNNVTINVYGGSQEKVMDALRRVGVR